MASAFLSRLDAAQAPLLADGAMGTMLHTRGVAFSTCFDALNLSDPAIVAEVHHAYVEAGSDIILSNTFGANRYKLDEHGLGDQVGAINRAGVELARRVVLAAFREVFVAGDIGPLGVRLAPYGRVQVAQAREAFLEQISALVEAGPDLLVIETMTDLEEALAAVWATRAVTDLPVVASMTFTRDDRTLLGDAPPSWPGRLSRRSKSLAELLGRSSAAAADSRADARRRARRTLRSSPIPAGPNRSPGASATRRRRSTWRVHLGLQEGGRWRRGRVLRHNTRTHRATCARRFVLGSRRGAGS